MTTPAYVQFAQHEYGFNANPMTVTLTGTTAGNAIVVIGGNEGSAGVSFSTPSDGVNTYSICTGASCSGTDDVGTQAQAFIAFGISGGTVNLSMPVIGSGNAEGIYAIEISGVTTYDNGGGATGTIPTTASTAPYTLNFSNEIVVSLCISQLGSATIGSGYSLIAKTSSFSWLLQYGLISPGSITTTANSAGDGNHAWGIIGAGFYTPAPPAAPGLIISPRDAIFFGIT